MKILVCISKAPDTTTKIGFTENNTRFNESGVQYIVNPYDEWYALVRALELKEKDGGTVTIINVGKADNEPVIRKALAIGADDAVRVDAEPADSLQVAKLIAGFAREKGYDLIMTGKETINYNGSAVGGMIAQLLDMPFISLATKLEVVNGKATIEQDITGGTQVVEASLPLVLSAAKGMAEARIPNMRGIMAARTKPLEVVTPANAESHTTIVQYSLPPEKSGVKMISPDNMEELVNLLHNEAKVI